MDERFQPGPERPQGEPQTLCDDGLWVPTGKADAVAFLGERRHQYLQDGYLHKEILFESLEGEAIRYLRPCSDRWHRINPRMVGVSRPGEMAPIIPVQLYERAREERRPVRYLVCSESKGLKHAGSGDRWKWKEVQEGIWAGLFD